MPNKTNLSELKSILTDKVAIKFIILTCDFIRFLRKLLILGDFRRFSHCDSNTLESANLK